MPTKTYRLFSVLFFISLFSFSTAYAQSLPINFETSVVTADFTDFDGGTATVIANPQSGGINTSDSVAQIIRNGGETFAGSKIKLDAPLDFSTASALSMKVYTTAPVGTVVKFKLEGNGATERDMLTTVSGEWEVITWDFTGEPTNFDDLVFMFDFGNVGDGSASSTFLFDDVEQISLGAQIDLPVDFESNAVNYTLTDFEGNASFLVVDPTNANNMVAEILKDDQAGSSAGTTIGTPAGFATNIPLALDDAKMTVKVWSPTAGTPVRLKVEDANDPTHTCETQTNTTVAADWETLTFDFTNEAPGTVTLSTGLSMGWTYNMASIFFNFGTDGASAGSQTYYFDDVSFGEIPLSNFGPIIEDLQVFPNPATNQWTVQAEQSILTAISLYDLQGKLVYQSNPHALTEVIDAAAFTAGVYICKISSKEGASVVRLVKE